MYIKVVLDSNYTAIICTAISCTAISCTAIICTAINHVFNPLTSKDPYSCRTAPLTSKRCILCIYSTNTGTEYFKHGI